MTTFFQHRRGRQVVDTWSTRMASFRTSEIIAIRRLVEPVGPPPGRRTDSGADLPVRPVTREIWRACRSPIPCPSTRRSPAPVRGRGHRGLVRPVHRCRGELRGA